MVEGCCRENFLEPYAGMDAGVELTRTYLQRVPKSFTDSAPNPYALCDEQETISPVI
jgi:hypothetical protein